MGTEKGKNFSSSSSSKAPSLFSLPFIFFQVLCLLAILSTIIPAYNAEPEPQLLDVVSDLLAGKKTTTTKEPVRKKPKKKAKVKTTPKFKTTAKPPKGSSVDVEVFRDGKGRGMGDEPDTTTTSTTTSAPLTTTSRTPSTTTQRGTLHIEEDDVDEGKGMETRFFEDATTAPQETHLETTTQPPEQSNIEQPEPESPGDSGDSRDSGDSDTAPPPPPPPPPPEPDQPEESENAETTTTAPEGEGEGEEEQIQTTTTGRPKKKVDYAQIVKNAFEQEETKYAMSIENMRNAYPEASGVKYTAPKKKVETKKSTEKKATEKKAAQKEADHGAAETQRAIRREQMKTDSEFKEMNKVNAFFDQRSKGS